MTESYKSDSRWKFFRDMFFAYLRDYMPFVMALSLLLFPLAGFLLNEFSLKGAVVGAKVGALAIAVALFMFVAISAIFAVVIYRPRRK